MADNDEKILKALDALQADVTSIKGDITSLKQGQARLEDGQAHLTTAVEAVGAGQTELQETVATRADIQDLRADLGKKVKKLDERVDELEKDAGIPHPHKH